MCRVLMPVMVLASVAITSTTTLPLLPENKPESTSDDGGKHTDNTFSQSNSVKNSMRDIFYKIPFDTNEYGSPEKTPRYGKINDERSELGLDDFIGKENAYNDEGFRKEQWHNYPRRLDRLQDYIFSFQIRTNQVSDEYDKDNILGQHKKSHVSESDSDKDVRTNEFGLGDFFSAANPILILKIRLACLNNQNKNAEMQNYEDYTFPEKRDLGAEFGLLDNEMSPATKVKPEGAIPQDPSSGGVQSEKKTVNKRLFSLWSRLQSLSHKGHELPHRRHIAFYSIPEDGASADALNTQTRALLRPPGSPLRWG